MHRNGKTALGCVSEGHCFPKVILTQFPHAPAIEWGAGGGVDLVLGRSHGTDFELLELCMGSRIMLRVAGHSYSQALQAVLPIIYPSAYQVQC